MADSFLSDLWARKREGELGDNKINRDVRFFLDIKAQAAQNPDCMKLFSALELSIRRYYSTVRALALTKREELGSLDEMNKKRLESADEQRRLAHEALVSSLDALSRSFRKAGIDNEWRRTIGLDHNAIGEWAVRIGSTFSQLGQ